MVFIPDQFKMEWELEGGILGEVIWTQSFSPTDCDYTKPALTAANLADNPG